MPNNARNAHALEEANAEREEEQPSSRGLLEHQG